MKRYIGGLHEGGQRSINETGDGLFLVRVTRIQYYWHSRKPFYLVHFAIIKPKHAANNALNARLYCHPKSLWKLNWFLRDFGYDGELLSRDEIDEKLVAGLSGVVKISHLATGGAPMYELESFAAAERWDELRNALVITSLPPEAAR